MPLSSQNYHEKKKKKKKKKGKENRVCCKWGVIQSEVYTTCDFDTNKP